MVDVDQYHRQYLNINSITTPVISTPDPIGATAPNEVIIIVPGNPGITHIYMQSLKQLHNTTHLPVWVAGHAGHETPTPEDIAEYKLKHESNDVRYNLDDQLQHKLQFLKQYTEPSTRIHLVGHSIGAWIVLNLLKDDVIKSRIVTAELLFPAMQRIATTPWGVLLNLARKVNCLITLLIWIVYKIPSNVIKIMIGKYLSIGGAPPVPKLVDVIVDWINPRVVGNMFSLGYDVMDHVNELDVDTIMTYKDKISILYTPKDRWVPKEWMLDLKETIPSIQMLELPYRHAFTLYDTKVGEIAAELIMKTKQ